MNTSRNRERGTGNEASAALPVPCSLFPVPVVKGSQRGQALVEFGLVSLVLVLVVVNTVDVMRGLWFYNTLAFAAREGTRYAIVHGSRSDSPVGSGNPTAVVTAVQNQATGLDPDLLTVVVQWPDGNNSPGSRVQVDVGYAYEPIVLGWFTPNLTSRSVMVIQQ